MLAGIGVESPRASFSGPTGSRPSFTGPLSPRAVSASAVGGGGSLLAQLAVPGAAAAAMAGAMAASGGSFSMFAPPGTPGRSRFSCPADEHQLHGSAAFAAADQMGGSGAPNLLCMGVEGSALGQEQQPPQQQYWPGVAAQPPASPQAWTVGADGYRVPLVPVVLPGGGVAYFPADSVPPGLVAAPTQDAAAAGSSTGGIPEGSPTLSGGIGPAFVEVQMQCESMQQQQYQQQQYQPAEQAHAIGASCSAGVEGAGVGSDGFGAAAAEQLRAEARLQDRAEAIFGQPMGPGVDAAPAQPEPAAASVPGEGGDRSAATSFAWSLPLPPLAALGAQQQAGAPQSAAAAGEGGSSGPGLGWMCDSMPAHAPGAGGFSLWDGVVAAAGSQAPGGAHLSTRHADTHCQNAAGPAQLRGYAACLSLPMALAC